jgi:hypothetical protein
VFVRELLCTTRLVKYAQRHHKSSVLMLGVCVPDNLRLLIFPDVE